MHKHLWFFILTVALWPVGKTGAESFMLGDNSLNLFGFFSQSIQASTAGDVYDNEEGVNALLMNAFIEADYRTGSDLKLYGSGMFTADWIYDAKQDDDSWKEKMFDKSRDNMYIDDEWWQMLKEAHATWSPGNCMFRLGKQIVSWGEMDANPIANQINPLDKSRGVTDVEFETQIIPIPLLRSEYHPDLFLGPLSDFTVQFVFNPNADFISNKQFSSGNDVYGINAVNMHMLDVLRVGRENNRFDEPQDWDSDYYEYGVRISGLIQNNILSFMGFYGIDDTHVFKLDSFELAPYMDTEGSPVVIPTQTARYPREKFVAASFAGELTGLSASALGGVTPVLRLEAKYDFDKTYTNQQDMFGQRFVKSDAFTGGVNLEYKLGVKSLQKSYFAFIAEYYYNRILDYESGLDLYEFDHPFHLKEEQHTSTLIFSTSYLNARLVPQIAWIKDYTYDYDIIVPSIAWQYTSNWNFSLRGAIIDGKGPDYELIENKGAVSFKVKYSWG